MMNSKEHEIAVLQELMKEMGTMGATEAYKSKGKLPMEVEVEIGGEEGEVPTEEPTAGTCPECGMPMCDCGAQGSEVGGADSAMIQKMMAKMKGK